MKKRWRWTRKAWRTLHHVEYAWYLLNEEEERTKAAESLRKLLCMPERVDFSRRPHISWKDAVHWMIQYGIVMADGGAGFEYLARLPKDKWERDISPDADPKWYSSWFLRKPEEVDDICAWARWPEIAVAQCVLNAKKAGVI